MCPLACGLAYFRPKVDLSFTFLMQILADYELSKTQGVWLRVLAEPSRTGTAAPGIWSDSYLCQHSWDFGLNFSLITLSLIRTTESN